MSASIIAKLEVAVDSPLAPFEEESYRAATIETWKHLLLSQDGLEAEALPRAFDENGEIIEKNAELSEEILSRVGGLVIASYRSVLLPFDESVLLHMNQAAEANVPVFVQTPYDEVIKRRAGTNDLPGEVITMELHQHTEIMERLQGES